MNSTFVYHVVLPVVMLALFSSSCSSEKGGEVIGQRPSEVQEGRTSSNEQNRDSGLSADFKIVIQPAEPTRKTVLRAIPQDDAFARAEIVWMVNDKAVEGKGGLQFDPSEAKKGDKVQAIARAGGKEAVSNVVVIKNTPPELTRVKIMPEVFRPGDTFYIEAEAADIDGDDVSILYEWTVNGEHVSESKNVGRELKRGDKISVKITPFDGGSYGKPITLDREIRNFPPTIIDDRKFTFDGKVYTYQVRATDPDGDALTYSIKSGPEGMTIGPSTGLIRWDVPLEFKGSVPVTVSVTDGNGGEATYNFKVIISPGGRPGT